MLRDVSRDMMSFNYLVIAIRLNVIFKRLQRDSRDDREKAIYIIRKTIGQIIQSDVPGISKQDHVYVIMTLTQLMYKIQQNDPDVIEYMLSIFPCYFQQDYDEMPEAVRDVTRSVFA